MAHSTTELGVVKQRIPARADPEIAEAKAATVKALAQCESATWRCWRQPGVPSHGFGHGHAPKRMQG